MFGIGDYTFAPWKVAVSGLHKDIRFRLVRPHDGRPVVFDDTCYMLAFELDSDAAIAAALCESEPARDLIRSLTFPDSKRPVTKRVLSRIDLGAIAAAVNRREVLSCATEMLGRNLDDTDWERMVARMSNQTLAV